MKAAHTLWPSTILLLVLATPKASLASMTGVELRDNCRWSQQEESTLTEEQHLKYSVCVSYVLGLTEGFYLGGGKSCVPSGEGVTNGQLGLVVFKYLDAHPEELHLHSGLLVVRALKKAFPCK